MASAAYGDVLERIARLPEAEKERLLGTLAQMVRDRSGEERVLSVLAGVAPAELSRTVPASMPVSAGEGEASPSGAKREALSLAGAWSDLDWDAMEAALDRIRHEEVAAAEAS